MKTSLPIIDTHFHIWNTNVLTLPWLNRFEGRLKARYTLEDYLMAIKDLNIIKSCYEEVDAVKSQHVLETEMAIELCHNPSNQVVAATIAADLQSEDFYTYINAFLKDSVVKSVRHNFFASNPSISKERSFVKNVHYLGELGIMCDIVMPAEFIMYGVELVESCPDTTFVINHCGVCPILADKKTKSSWRRGIERYGLNKNTLCKVSECGFTNPDYQWQISDVIDIIKHCLTSFGAERVVYGSNWPVCEMTGSIARWIEAIETCLPVDSEYDAQKLFHDNATARYGL